jgi:D-beta-D-heptose 7-phosphate kinase/D-beta-D-heptose 1-phosphate adenosyltransferase
LSLKGRESRDRSDGAKLGLEDTLLRAGGPSTTPRERITMNLIERIGNLRGGRAAVVGDVMLDHYVWGDTHRISPEAPVPVIEVMHESHSAGGAANVALNLASLGIGTSLCGTYGTDAAGFRLAGLLAERGVVLSQEHASPDRKTITKTRVMVQRQQMCRIDVEDPPSSYGMRSGRALSYTLGSVEAAGFVVISDYAKGVLTQPLVDAVCACAKKRGGIVAWDPKPRNPIVPQAVTVLTPNRSEACQLAGVAEPRHGEAFRAAAVGAAIFERYRPQFLVVTLGSDGMMLYEGPDRRRHLPTMAREVFDVSGAGDTVVAVLAAGLAAGWDLFEAATAANAAAGLVVAKVGTATIAPGELADALSATGRREDGAQPRSIPA